MTTHTRVEIHQNKIPRHFIYQKKRKEKNLYNIMVEGNTTVKIEAVTIGLYVHHSI